MFNNSDGKSSSNMLKVALSLFEGFVPKEYGTAF